MDKFVVYGKKKQSSRQGPWQKGKEGFPYS
jgi:hypothetical protein